jgi:hypothetical protein
LVVSKNLTRSWLLQRSAEANAPMSMSRLAQPSSREPNPAAWRSQTHRCPGPGWPSRPPGRRRTESSQTHHHQCRTPRWRAAGTMKASGAAVTAIATPRRTEFLRIVAFLSSRWSVRHSFGPDPARDDSPVNVAGPISSTQNAGPTVASAGSSAVGGGTEEAAATNGRHERSLRCLDDFAACWAGLFDEIRPVCEQPGIGQFQLS